MKSEISKKNGVLTIKRGPGTGMSESQTLGGFDNYKELYDKGAEIKIMPDSERGSVRFYFGYDSEAGKQFKRDLVVSRKQVKEILQHLIDLAL